MLTNSLANASYVYNGFDARVSKTVASTTTTFKRAGADPVSPVLADTVGGTTTNYLPGISSRTGGTSTFSHSGIKNGLLQTNSSQTNTATKRYDAFGNELSTTGTWQTRFDYGGGFGYQRDDESGYKLLGHRYYDPEIGRFLTRDPAQDGRNWFAYCDNDPVWIADPSGLRPLTSRDKKTLRRLYAHSGSVPTKMINNAVREIKAEIAAVPVGSSDPIALRALLRAINDLGNTEWGKSGQRWNFLGRDVTGLWKCNSFVLDAYAMVGAKVPSTTGLRGMPNYPSANDLAGSDDQGRFKLVAAPAIGDVVSFGSSGNGHTSLKVGSGLLIYAGKNDAQLGTFGYVRPKYSGGVTFRRYQ
jgi:RHS repeat-associated protein